MMLLVIAVGVGAWALGRTQIDGIPGSGGGASGWGPNAGGHTYAGAGAGAGAGGPTPNTGGPPPPPPPHSSPPPPQSGPTPGGPTPKSSWQQRPAGEQQKAPGPQPQPETPKNAWERAREETRKKEEERKAKEAEQKRKEETAKRLRELREKEARERAKRDQEAKEKADREKEQREKEQREKAQREKDQQEKERKEKEGQDKDQRQTRLNDARERDLRERLEREKATRERLEKEAKQRQDTRLKEEAAESTRKSTYAYSSVGEKTNPWPNGRPPSQPASPANPNPNPSSAKRPPAPTARTFTGTDEEAYSYRPYDQPKRHTRRRSGETVFTESSYAPSQSTARTSPPPSMRGPYSTKDPDKIVIKAVYSFMNQFAKTPASQLISGQGTVTDGLILRITTEGLFIDDDVRGVPQREWDVKAWTLKLMEVWCSSRSFAEPSATSNNSPKVLHKPARVRVDRGLPKTLTGDDADGFLTEMLQTCKNECRLCPHGDDTSSYANTNSGGQSGEWKQRGLHVLRATIRDQEGKRYMFVLGEEEGWKVAAGLQRLRKGTQVRQLGVQAMSVNESRTTLELLGWL